MVNEKKVVVNKQHGGFGLSAQGVLAYAKLKGLTVYPTEESYGGVTFWTVPLRKRPVELSNWAKATLEERQANNKAFADAQIYDRDISRDDLDLVSVVENLGDKANGKFASLRVVSIPADVEYTIEEYDGLEWIAEKHRTW